jgi:predicted DNA-binding transcriptional regulator YafY
MNENSTTERHEGRGDELRRIARVLSLLSLISAQPRRWPRKALATKYEVTERQIDKDLAVLRHGLCCDIQSVKKQGYYVARLPALPAVHYTATEALALLTALRLAQASGSVDPASLATALARTEEALPAEFAGLLRMLQLAGARQSVQAAHRSTMLALVERSLLEGRALRVIYESASRGGAQRDRVLQPYHLEPYPPSWMVTAHDNLSGEIRNFRIDRIISAELTETRYKIPLDFDAVRYQGGGWGILRGMAGPEQEVVLRFTPEEGRRARDEGHHPSQSEKVLPDGGVEMRFKVGITSEMVRWVLRWAGGCTVLAPEELRQQVAEAAGRIAEQHRL